MPRRPTPDARECGQITASQPLGEHFELGQRPRPASGTPRASKRPASQSSSGGRSSTTPPPPTHLETASHSLASSVLPFSDCSARRRNRPAFAYCPATPIATAARNEDQQRDPAVERFRPIASAGPSARLPLFAFADPKRKHRLGPPPAPVRARMCVEKPAAKREKRVQPSLGASPAGSPLKRSI